MSIDDAVDLYRESIIPALREQRGYAGCYVLATPEGKAEAITFWDSEEAAEAGIESGFYGEQVAKFVTVFRSPPGRERYDVVIAEAPAATPG